MNLHSKVPYLSGNVGGDIRAAILGATGNLNTKLGLATGTGFIAGIQGVGVDFLEGQQIPMTAWQNSPLLAFSPNIALTNAFFEFPEDIKTYALSASTTVAGWSVGAEISYSPNFPIQLSAADFLYAVVNGEGPVGTDDPLGMIGVGTSSPGLGITATGNLLAGTLSPLSGQKKGYERVSKTQFQINGLNTLPSMLGATGGLLIAEAGFQWADISDSNGSNKRYGRAFGWGAGAHTTYGLAGGGVSKALASNAGSKNDGYMTDFAWGYRVNASLNYPGFLGTSWQFTPSVFWSHDVDGVSIDYQFNEGNKTLGLTAGFSLNNMHSVKLNYTTYSNSADYNLTRDRDNVSVVYSYTF